MSVPNSYGNSLPLTTLNDLMGLLETVEGYGKPSGNPAVYLDGSGNPTIGYGFLLYNVGHPGNGPTDGLYATLDQITNAVGSNVFEVSTMSAGQIGAYFCSLLSRHATSTTLSYLLSWAISDLFAGVTLNPGQDPPITQGQNPSVSFSLTTQQAGRALFNLIEGGQVADGQITLSGASPQAYTTFANLLNLTGGQNITGAAPGTPQWEALVALVYNGIGIPKSIAPTIATGLSFNAATTWYALRYIDWNTLSSGLSGGGNQTRNYLQSAMFGLNGGVTVSGSAALFEQAQQDYEVLSQYRQNIIAAERTFGADPDGTGPEKTPTYAVDVNGNRVLNAQGKPIATALYNANYDARNMGAYYRYSSGADTIPASGSHGAVPVAPITPPTLSNANLTLAATFDPEAIAVMNYLNYTYSVLPQLQVDTMGRADTAAGSIFEVRSTDIFAASPNPGNSIVDAATGDGDRFEEAGRNHILLGTATNETLIGGSGNDILVAGAGNEYLQCGTGADTLIAGQGSDTLSGGQGTDVFDVEFANNLDPNVCTETIVTPNANGALYINGAKLGGGLTATGIDTWTDGTYNYQFTKGTNISQTDLQGTNFAPADFAPWVGELEISRTSSLNTAVGSVDILGFNLHQAEATGFLGINLPSSLFINYTANQGVDPPDSGFAQGANQSYTLSVDASSNSAQTIAVSLAGASAGDFEATIGGTIEQLNANGTFNVTLAAGETSVAFTLTDVTPDDGSSDIANGATLQLTASLPNPDTVAGGSIQTTPLTFTYVPSSVSSPGADTIDGTDSGGVTSYDGDQGNDFVSAASGLTYIALGLSANDTVIGNGSTSVILAGEGNSEIYAGAQTSLANAIAAASTAVATGLKGDLIAVGHGDNTIIGSNGNDFIATDSTNPDGTGGSDVVVLGAGNDTYAGGYEVTDASTNWSVTASTSSSDYIFYPSDISVGPMAYVNPYAQPYNGSVETTDPVTPSGVSNASIYGGTGNYLIALGNGNNYVDIGSGNSTVACGMGDNTIIAGSGTQDILGGGGPEYVAGGSGSEIIYGGDGDNTIIGGSGNATIFSSTLYSEDIPFANDDLVSNYVTGGSGNDLIYGSAGSDTLIGGTGNVTIIGGSGNEDITGGSGNDYLTGGTGNTTIDAGGAGSDSLVALGSSSSTSVLYGGDGVDYISGGSGSNTLYAGDGGTAGAATTVLASQSDATATTTIYGGTGVDLLEGGAGTSVIYAGDGGTSAAPTTVEGSSGAQTLYGGLGTDLLEAGSGTAVLYAGDGGTSTAPTTVLSGSGLDTLNGGAGPSLLEDTVSGQDLLVSSTADDTLIGIGNDTLVAGTGNDLLQTNGGATNFEFNAGFGNDTVIGQGGTVNLLLGTGLLATDFTGSVAFDEYLNNYLTLSGDGGSITIENALTGGLVSAAYADPATIPLQTLLGDAFGGDQTISAGNYTSLILGLANNDLLTPLENYDTISAWGNNDTIDGEASYTGVHIYATGSSVVVAGQEGGNTINVTGSNATVTGGIVQDHITVSGANALVTTKSGYDTITASGANDTLVAVSGNSQFNVNNSSTLIQLTGAAAADVIIATVSYTAPTNVNTLTLAGSANIAATGNAGLDQLTAGAGNDTLTAGSGLATLIGGSGATTFVVNNTGDSVQGASSATNNTLQSSVSFTLPTNVNTLLLTGTAALVGTANSANDTLTSNSGVDTLFGGPGNDTFILNNPNDVVIDTAGTATLIYAAAANYTLPAISTLLVLTGTAALQATGNANADTLISNSGIDTLIGGTGNDTFVVNNSLDVVQDSAVGTSNLLLASVTYSLPTNVNALTMTGSAALSATGNSASDILTANSGNDTLIAGSGIATLIGGTGNETFVVNNAGDVIQDASPTANNTLMASISATLGPNVNTLVLLGTGALVGTANGGNDTLISNMGVDTLFGSSGNDTFIINNVGDLIQDTASGATNTALSSVNYSLANNVNVLTLTGTNALIATGNSGNDVLTANSGADTLVAGSGFDTLVSGITQANSLVGGTGNDLFIINNSADTVSVGSVSGYDTIQSSYSTTLPTGVNVLCLTGSGNLTGAAISGNNELIGNAGNDILEGGSGSDDLVAGSGIDTLVGGGQTDNFVIDNSADVIESLSTIGNAVQSSVSYSLPTNAASLILTGSANLQAIGNSQTNFIAANAGNDTVISGTGVTTFATGYGSDLFIINNSNDSILGSVYKFGTDTIDSSVSYTVVVATNLSRSVAVAADLVLIGSGNLLGADASGKATMLVGNAGNDTLVAGTGRDTLVAGSGVTTLVGGSGNDTFIVNNVNDVIQDTAAGSANVLLSSVSVSLPNNVNSILLTGSSALTVAGNSANDSLVGNAGADTLVAGSGADTLVAGAGLATLEGGAGNDTFVVNNAADLIQNASAGSPNALISSATYVLPTNVNVLTLTGLGNISGTGNAAADTLTAGAGADTLIAGTALATLIGGLGNTTFVLNASGDVVLDSFAATNDTVSSSASYALVNNVNTLALTGTTALTGAANGANDTLISNWGVDTLVGGSASDTFVINNSSDIVQDTLASGSNTAQSSVNYSLAADVNTLVLTGTAALLGTANSASDTLVSNSGIDTLIGGAGNDTFVLNNTLDVVQGSAGETNSIVSSVNYTLPTNVNALTLSGSASLIAMGNSGADIITANTGNDTLSAGSGTATLIGGQGADTFIVNNASDVVQDSFASGNNALQSSVSFSLANNVNTLTLTGTSALVGTANAGNDTIVSNAGLDTLVGGSGNDLFIVNNPGDVILNGSANDTIESGGNFTLPSSINNLVITGTANISVTGNANSDVISANSGADTLIAGTGPATLIGGAGNDVFVLYSIGAPYGTQDVVQDPFTGTNSTVYSPVDFVLPANVDSLVLTGSAAAAASGNGDANNVITANSGNDMLVGTAFSNTLIGGAGNDTIEAGPGQNVIYAGGGAGSVVYGNAAGTSSSTQSTIYGSTGGGALYGGPGTDLIIGAAGADVLTAGAGYDTLVGAAGNYLFDGLSGVDVLIAGAGAETLYATGFDTLEAGSGNDYLSGINSPQLMTFEFGPTVGQDTISSSGSSSNIVFNGISPGAVTATETLQQSYGNTTGVNLVLNDGSGSIQIMQGLTPGVVNTLQFGGGVSMTLAQFLNAYGPGNVTIGTGTNQSLLSTGNSTSVVLQSTDEFAYTFGNADSVTGNTGYYPVYVYGNNTTVNSAHAVIVGSNDVMTGQYATLTGANDTVASSAGEAGTFLVEQSSTVFNAAVNSRDSITSTVNFTLPTNVALLTLDNASLTASSNSTGGTLVAGSNYDTVIGGSGSDTLVAGANFDDLIGGTGVETFVLSGLNAIIQLGSGTASQNTVVVSSSYTLGGAANSLTETGSYSRGVANSANDSLTATAYGDTLVASTGNDTLVDGSSSGITMVGGSGSDTFVVTNAADVIVDSYSVTTNVIESSVSFSLPGTVNTLVLGGFGGITATANSGNDSLVSGNGGDTLVAGAGLDTLVSGGGPDTFVFNAGFGHELISNVGNGDDIQFGAGISQSSLTFSATLGANGSAPSLVIAGDGGSVSVQGGLLPGAISAIKFTGGGSYTVGQLVAPTGRETVTGLHGNLIISTVNGDLISGGSGNDTIDAYGNNDTLNAGIGGALIYAAGAHDRVSGGAANDTLDALGASNTLIGGSGHETFLVNDPSTVVQVSAAVGTDVLVSSVNYTVPTNISVMTMTGTAALQATGNSGNDLITGNAGFDTFTAGTGIDTLLGGSSADTFYVNNSADVVLAAVGATGDLVYSTAATFTLPANINSLIVGSGASGSGNTANDSIQGATNSTLIAGSGNDTLTAYSGTHDFLQGGSGQDLLIAAGVNNTFNSGTGIDTLWGIFSGAPGNDYFINNSADDLVSIQVSDSLNTSVNYTLTAPSDLTSLSSIPWNLLGTGGIVATDSVAANVIFDAMSPNDTMVGGPDNNQFIVPYGTSLPETYIGGPTTNEFLVQSAADVVTAPVGSSDTLTSYVNYTLPANVNTLEISYAGTVGVANGGNDTLFADGDGETLIAGSGNDSLDCSGADTLVGGSGNDTLTANPIFLFNGGSYSQTYNPDVFLINSGFGSVLINGSSPMPGPLVDFGAGVTETGMRVTAALDPLGNAALKINSGTSSVTLDGVENGNTYEVGFAGGSRMTLAQFLSQVPVTTSSVTGASGTVFLEGSVSTKLTGASGNETLYAAAAYDSLVAGSGAQYLNALGSNETLIDGAGTSTLVGYAGGTTYVISNSNTIVREQLSDTIESSISADGENVIGDGGTIILTGSAALVAGALEGGGPDTLVANSGADTLYGGVGGDTFVINSAADLILESLANPLNAVLSSVSYTLLTNINQLTLTGSGALIGRANGAADKLTSNAGVDTLVGGAGNDTFLVNNAADVIQDTFTSTVNLVQATVKFTLPLNVNQLMLSGSGNLSGTGNSANDSLVGGVGLDTLTAGSGTDTLVAGTGLSTLIGGSGSDVFVVNNAADLIQDSASGASNSVQSSANYSLSTNVNALTLTGTAALVAAANSGTDTLTSNAGLDTLVGGAGNDTFVINNAGDVIQEAFTATTNVARSAVSYSLMANVNTLILTGSSNLLGSANTGNDSLTANAGSDTLTGGAGVDTLVAGSGVDTLIGGSGNTTFMVNSSSDVVQDTYAAAINTLDSSVSYVLPTAINVLVFTGTNALKGTANNANDTLTSNSGVDTLVGGGGNDVFAVNNGNDSVQDTWTTTSNVVDSTVAFSLPTNVNALVFMGSTALHGTGNSGNDSMVANSGADTLSAGGGSDTLVSSATGSAVDSLVGGTGADLFVVNYAGDIVSVGTTHGIDTIQSSVSYTNAANVANLVLTGTGNLSGTGTTTASQITANSGADTLTAGSATATLVGGTGNDTFIVNSTSDVVQDTSSTAINSIQSSVSYSLPTNVNQLILTGTGALLGTANAGNDTLTANTGADTLVSGSGNAIDSLIGGTGADVFVVNNTSDTVNVGTTHGVDTIESSVSYSASANVAKLVLTGTSSLLGTGNALAGTLTANSGNDTLTAGSGADTLVGGTGTDLFVVNSASDIVSLGTSGTSDTIQSSASYTLPTNVQYLTLTGTAALAGTGNTLTDLIVGNSGADTLTGGTGIDVLEGGRTAGSDQIKAASNQAALIAGASSSTLTGGAYKDFYAAGKVSDSITTGATANVIAVNSGDGATTLQPTTGATDVLSLGAGIDTESLKFTKTGNNLILSDGVSGDSITFANWYVGTSDQDVKTLQVVEIASASYKSGGTDGLRNKPLEDFNFTSLVAAYNAASSPANWALSTAMPSAQLTSTATADYGGDLGYYFGLNGNLTGVNLSAVQSTLTNTSYATANQTIDAFASITGGSGLHLLVAKPDAPIARPVVPAAPHDVALPAPVITPTAAKVVAAAATSVTIHPPSAAASVPVHNGPLNPPSSAIKSKLGIEERPSPTTQTPNTTTRAGSIVTAAIIEATRGRPVKPDLRLPINRGDSKSYVDPVSLAWLKLDPAFAERIHGSLAGAEAVVAHEEAVFEGLGGHVPLERTRRGTAGPAFESASERQRLL